MVRRELDLSKSVNKTCAYYRLGKCTAKKCNYEKKYGNECKVSGNIDKVYLTK